jgi:REP element-mobilizing transposase RayT
MRDWEKYPRKTLRLKGYDYNLPGLYFVTICARARECTLGIVEEGRVHLSDIGKIVTKEWSNLLNHYPNIGLDEFVIMPNHVHGIIEITTGRGGFRNPPLQKQYGLPEIVRGFKTWSARKINEHQNTEYIPFWQRSFYDHIIRNEKELYAIRKYIRNNPLQWELDQENPKNRIA